MASPAAAVTSSAASAKSGDGYDDPPLLMATPLPPQNAFQQVIIDDFNDDFIALETTPLVAVYSSSVNRGSNLSTADDDLRKDGPEAVCRDWLFGLVFYIQFVLFVLCASIYSPLGYKEIDQFLNYTFIRDQIEAQSDDTVTLQNWEQFDSFVSEVGDYIDVYSMRIFIWSVVPSALLGVLWVHITVLTLPSTSYWIVKASLILILSLAAGIVVVWLAVSPSFGSLLMASFLCGTTVYYVHLVWPMIPFAAINLKAAAKGINANMGTHFWAFCACMLGVLWLLFWIWGTLGIMAYLDDQCNAKHGIGDGTGDSLHSQPIKMLHNTTRWLKKKEQVEPEDMPNCGQGGLFMLLLLSNYWTYLVLMNTVEVTVAGVMATWCYDKEAASGCCSPAVASSLYRSITYSFGSICLGSLLQGIMQAIRKVVPNRSRSNSNDQCCGLCFCVIESFGRVVDESLDYFNQWAYVFVGIYGYGYVESGRKVLELFVSKGWTNIISERLATYVTGCITVAVGIATGLSVWIATVLVDTMLVGKRTEDSGNFVYGPVPQHASFFVGFVIGAVIASVMMSVVRGGASTLIVCFADSPARLEENHPELTLELIDAWATAFPETIQSSSFYPPMAEPVTTTEECVVYPT